MGNEQLVMLCRPELPARPGRGEMRSRKPECGYTARHVANLAFHCPVSLSAASADIAMPIHRRLSHGIVRTTATATCIVATKAEPWVHCYFFSRGRSFRRARQRPKNRAYS